MIEILFIDKLNKLFKYISKILKGCLSYVKQPPFNVMKIPYASMHFKKPMNFSTIYNNMYAKSTHNESKIKFTTFGAMIFVLVFIWCLLCANQPTPPFFHRQKCIKATPHYALTATYIPKAIRLFARYDTYF